MTGTSDISEYSARGFPLWAAAAFLLAVFVTGCGGESGSGNGNTASGDDAAGSGPREVSGSAVKGPLQGSGIDFFVFDAAGEPDGAPVASATTDNGGNFTVTLPSGTPNVLVAASGGGFYDESDPAGLRFIAWPASEALFGFLGAGQSRAPVTPVSDWLVRKSRRDTANGLGFNHSISENRQQAILALGFDPAAINPPNPLDPPANASAEEKRYALMLGGIAHAVNTAATHVGLPAPDFEVLHAVLVDFEDCVLDGSFFGDPLFANGQQLPANSLDHEIERFRNNNFDKYGNFALRPIDVAHCRNQLPIARNDAADTDEDVAVNIPVLGNDDDFDGSLVAASLQIVEQPAHGKVSINVSGGFIRYVPAANYFGNDSFRYRLKDDLGARTNTARVALNVADVNDAPVARNDARALLEDAATVSINVLANDDDIDGTLDPASVVIVSGPSHGTGSKNSAGRILYTPDADFSGSDEIRYRVRDDDGALSNTATVAITVGAVNDAPVIAVIDDAVIDEDTVLGPVGFSVDDVDQSPGTLVVSASSSNTALLPNANISLGGSGGSRTLTATPVADASDDSTVITVNVKDASGETASTMFTLKVDPVNDPPVAVQESFVVFKDGSFSTGICPGEVDSCDGVCTYDFLDNGASSLLANDTDIDNPPADLSVNGAPPALNVTSEQGASVKICEDGVFTYYSPYMSPATQDSFPYSAFDGSDAGNTATVLVTIVDPNPPFGSACIDPPNGLFAWYTGDSGDTDGTFIQDRAGSNHGSMLGGSNSGSFFGAVDEAMFFDGSTGVAEITSFPEPALITIDAWVRLGALSNSAGSSTQAVVSRRRNNATDGFESFYLGTGHNQDFVFGGFSSDGVGNFASTGDQVRIIAGVWYHVAGSYDGSVFRIFVNGQALDSVSAPAIDYDSSTSQPLYIGGNDPAGGDKDHPYQFEGLIDEVEFFDRALSESEIADIYNAGTAGKCKFAR